MNGEHGDIPVRTVSKRGRRFGASGPGSVFSILEEPFGSGDTMLLGFFFIVYLRSILEGLLEYEHLLGIRAVPAVSQAMLFLHFPAFYAAVFFLILTIITRLSGVGLPQAANTLLRCWPLILLPPVLDWFISSGSGYELGYIFDPRDILRAAARFWLPRSLDIAGVTPGMRLEISVACIGIGLYITVKRNIWRGIVGFLVMFLSLLFLGSLPALSTAAGLDGSWIVAGGFGNLQSQRFAILYGIMSGIFGVILLYRYDAVLFSAWFRCFRWLRTLLYALLPALGFWALYWVYKPQLDYVFLKTGDWISVAGLIVCQMVSFQAAALFNDLADEPWDRTGIRQRIFLTPGIRRSRVKTLGFILLGYGIFFAICVQYAIFLIVLIQQFIAWAYSFPPWRFKRVPVFSTLLVSTAAVLSFIAGGAVIGREWVFNLMPHGLPLALLLSFVLGFGFKDLADEDDDRRAGVRSLAVLVGSYRSRLLYALGIAVAFVSFPVISGLSILLIPAISFAVLGIMIVIRTGVSAERILIVALLVSLIVVGLAIRFDTGWLTSQRERIVTCPETVSIDPKEEIGVNAVRGWLPSYENREELVYAEGGALIGAYPWIIPRLCTVMGPVNGGELLDHAARAGICPGLASVAALECFASDGDRERWCDTLDGALLWNTPSPDFYAVAGRHADEFGFPGIAARLFSYGRTMWPTDPAVWGETARFLLKRGRMEEALHALRMARRNEPDSPQLEADIHRVEMMIRQQRLKEDRVRRSVE